MGRLLCQLQLEILGNMEHRHSAYCIFLSCIAVDLACLKHYAKVPGLLHYGCLPGLRALFYATTRQPVYLRSQCIIMQLTDAILLTMNGFTWIGYVPCKSLVDAQRSLIIRSRGCKETVVGALGYEVACISFTKLHFIRIQHSIIESHYATNVTSGLEAAYSTPGFFQIPGATDICVQSKHVSSKMSQQE